MNELILLIPILLPVIAGVLAGFLPLRRDRTLYPFVTTVLVINVAAVIGVALLPEIRFDVLASGSKFAIAFRSDDVSRLFFCHQLACLADYRRIFL